jgi:hypothetical protein
MMRQPCLGALCSVVIVLTCLAPRVHAQDRVQLNTITKIAIHDGVVEITGSRRANFTTFTLTEPSRLVIDVSEAVFQGVPRELPGAGPITGIRTASYGSESAAIARVMIGFSRELETDIVTQDATVIVKLPPEPGEAQKLASARVEADRAAKLKAEQDEKDRVARAKAEQEEKDGLAREEADKKKREAEEAKKQAEAERVAKLEAEKAEKERVRREAEEAKKQAEAERLAKLEAEKAEKDRARREAEALAKQQAEDQRLAKLEAEKASKEEKARKKREAEEAKARAEAEAKQQAEAERVAKLEAEKAGKEEKARKKREAEEAKARADLEAKQQAEAERVAKLEAEKASKEEKARKKHEAEEAKARAVAEAKQAADAQKLAKVEPVKAKVTQAERDRKERELDEANARTPSPSELAQGKSARMTFVGFKQEDGVGRISLRTSSPVRYSVGEDDREVVVTLENTQINLPNNQRILDTSFFDTAVSLVRPEEADHARVKIRISLKKAVAYRASQTGNELTLEFARPE